MTDVLCLVDDVYVDDHSAEEAVQLDADLMLPPPPPHIHMEQEEADDEDEQALPVHGAQQQQQQLLPPASQIPTLVEAALSENAAYMFSEEFAAGQAWATAFSHPAVLILTQFAWCMREGRLVASDGTPAPGDVHAEGEDSRDDRSGGGGSDKSSSVDGTIGDSSSSASNGVGVTAQIPGQSLSMCSRYCQCLYGVRLMSVYVFYVSTFDGPPGLLTWAWICAVSAWFLGPSVVATGAGESSLCWSTAKMGNHRSSSLGGSTLFFGTLESIDAEQQNRQLQHTAMDTTGATSRGDGGSAPDSRDVCLRDSVQPSYLDLAAVTGVAGDTGSPAPDGLDVLLASWFGVAIAAASNVLGKSHVTE